MRVTYLKADSRQKARFLSLHVFGSFKDLHWRITMGHNKKRNSLTKKTKDVKGSRICFLFGRVRTS